MSPSLANVVSRFSIRRHYPSVMASLCRLAVFVGFTTLLTICATETDPVKAELYPETQQPHFKTCGARA